jgi:hypothetical protein
MNIDGSALRDKRFVDCLVRLKVGPGRVLVR